MNEKEFLKFQQIDDKPSKCNLNAAALKHRPELAKLLASTALVRSFNKLLRAPVCARPGPGRDCGSSGGVSVMRAKVPGSWYQDHWATPSVQSPHSGVLSWAWPLPQEAQACPTAHSAGSWQ